MAPPLLQVRDLRVLYRPAGEVPVAAVDGISFDLAAGEGLGVLGESGCGKTSLALAIPGLLPPSGDVAGGEVRFEGRRLDGLSERRLERIRGAEIGLVFQQPALALHPTRRVGEQVAEVLRAHRPWSWPRCRRESLELFEEVGLKIESGIASAFPHQLSGGQRQRVVIAQALACRPRLLIADEPTAALDAATEARVLALLQRLKRRLAVALLYVSHDPRVLAEVADRLLVMYAGRMVEEGPCRQVLEEPLHPYPEALLGCLPLLAPEGERRRQLEVIPDGVPGAGGLEVGCRFAPRCASAMPVCRQREPPLLRHQGRSVVCFRHEDRPQEAVDC